MGILNILVINCGSSSIKYKFYEMPGERLLAKGGIEKIGGGRQCGKKPSPGPGGDT